MKCHKNEGEYEFSMWELDFIDKSFVVKATELDELITLLIWMFKSLFYEFWHNFNLRNFRNSLIVL